MRTRRRFRAHPASVGAARRLVRAALAEAGCEALTETAELVVSEIVTNAIVHAATPVDVEAIVLERGLRVEVGDGSRHAPMRRGYGGLAGTGRGLRMLEQLVDDWGVDKHPWGKTVWFELGTASTADRAVAGTAATGRSAAGQRSGGVDETGTAGLVEVVLLDVPLLLHAAWQSHAESLLREYLLVRLDEADVVTPLEEHAAVQDAMALLGDHIPAPDVGADPEAVMAGATEPLVTADRIVIPVPTASVAHFELLDDTLDTVGALAGTGALLTPPVQPELKLLRRWLCDQVLDQANGAPPAPWVADQQLPPPQIGASLWDCRVLDEIGQAPQALIAADDTNRILAVSGAALRLLGYGTGADLVGHRLVTIIPERYRQAHLAGFTLHLASGRSPLLGRPVVVPALRHDGTEVRVELTITARHHTGRSLFVAELRDTD